MKYRFALAAVALVISTGAHAQQVYIPPYNPGFMLLNDSIRGDPDSSAEEDDREQSQGPVAKVSSVNFNYSVSKSRTKENVAKFVSKARTVDPTGAAQMEQLFGSADIMEQINQALKSVGLRTDNVADAYAVWWVASWKAANQKTVSDSAKMYSAVKRQVEIALSSTPQFSSTSDALKQEMAESMLLQAAMIDAHVDAATGNSSQQVALAKAVNQGATKMELDLTTMDLTEQGFVPRSGKRSDAGDVVSGDADTTFAANDNGSDTGKLALYGVGGVALLAGMFALGKSFGGKG